MVQTPVAAAAPPPAPPQAAASWDQFLADLPGSPPAAPQPTASPQFSVPGFDAGAPASDRMTVPMMPAADLSAMTGAVAPAGAVPVLQMPVPAVQPQPQSALQAPKLATATEQLFSEDIIPDTEIGGEDVDKVRQNLFVKAESVWYGAPDEAPGGVAPATPPAPPKIPQGSGPQPQGYIKATDSIQVDPSLFAPVEKKEFQPSTPSSGGAAQDIAAGTSGMAAASSMSRGIELDVNDAGTGSIELAVTVPPHPSAPPQTQVPDLDDKQHHPQVRQHSAPIRLVAAAPKKQINITIPAIVVGVLLVSAGLFWVLAGRTDPKEKFDLASAPKTGVLPSAGGSASVKPQAAVEKKAEEKPETKTAAAVEEKKDEKKDAAPAEEKAKVAKKPPATGAKDADEPRTVPKDTGKKAAQEHYSLGNQYFMQQRFDMAAEEYKQAVRSDGSYAYAYRGLGAAYARLGKADLAVKQYEMYIKLVPAAPDAEQVKKIINDYYGK